MDKTERTGGMAFEVLLKPASAVSPRAVKTATPDARRISLELIDKKLKDAQGRREVWTSIASWSMSLSQGLINKGVSSQLHGWF